MKNLLFILSILLFSVGYGQNVALDLDGTDDYVQTSYNGISGKSARTVEAWIRTTANCNPGNGGIQQVITDWGANSSGARFTMNVLWGNALRIEVNGSGLGGQTVINDGKWHHVAVVYDSKASLNLRLLVDGVLDTAGNIPTTINTGTSVNMRIGRRIDGARYFDGEIDDVRVFDIVRTDSAIKADMNKEYCTYPKGLKAYYKLNDGVAGGTNTNNKSARDHINSKNGVLNNFALSGSNSNWVKGPNLTGGSSANTIKVYECNSYTSGKNKVYTNTGVFKETYKNQFGCDSILTIDLTIGKSFGYIITQACDSFVSPSGKIIKKSSVFLDTLVNGNYRKCDSIISVNVTIQKPVSTKSTIKTCDSALFNGVWYTKSQIVRFEGTGVNKCDSIHELTLIITKPSFSDIGAVACGSYISPSGKKMSKSGLFMDTLIKGNYQGCDSFIRINLVVNPTYDVVVDVVGCDSFVSPQGVVYNKTGLFKEKLSSINKCDSIVSYRVFIAKPVATNERIDACDSALIDGNWYYKDEMVQLNKKTYLGCDSIHSIHLVVTTGDPSVTQNADTLTANQIGAKYTWINCSTGKFAGTSRRVIPKIDGDYKVVIEWNGCSDTSECYTVSHLGLPAKNLPGFRLYPNPNNGKFSAEWSTNVGVSKLQIVDALGRIVLEKQALSGQSVQIDTLFERGHYYLLLVADNTIYTSSFIVQ